MIAFADLARQAGAGPPLVNYLTAKGLDCAATLALIVDNVADLVHQVTISGVNHSAQPENHAAVRAIITHMWREARRQDIAHVAPPQATPAPSPSPTTTVTSTGMSVDPDDKIPKTFAHWATQIDVYNNRLLDGKTRRFPENMLAGAESVLARVWREHTKTKAYTPISLGEILQKRLFTASGDVNPLTLPRLGRVPWQLPARRCGW